MLKKWLVFVFAVCMLAVFASGSALAWKWGRKTKAEVIKEKVENKIEKQKYIKSRDLDNDGKVTVKDRLLWIKANSGSTVYVSGENRSLAETIDEDGDGIIESWEMKRFYEKYDLNGDGAIDDVEIDKAEE